MSERLMTDDELARYDERAKKNERESGGGTVTMLTSHWLRVSAELRARRAADLSEADREALQRLRKVVSHAMEGDHVDAWLAVLDRLLDQGAKP